jgi:signal transduction histidine kinase
LERLLRLVAEEARAMIGAQLAVASLVVEGDWAGALHGLSLSEAYAADAKPGPQFPGHPLSSLAWREMRPVRMTRAELETHPDRSVLGIEAGGAQSMGGLVAVPLTVPEGPTLGVLRLSGKFDGEFTAEDEDRLVRFARMAAAAVEHARLFQEADAANKAGAQSMDKLLHDLRNPLNAIFLWGRLLRYKARDEAVLKEALDTIERNAKMLAHLLEQADPSRTA